MDAGQPGLTGWCFSDLNWCFFFCNGSPVFFATVPRFFSPWWCLQVPRYVFAMVSAGVLLHRLAGSSGSSVVVAKHTCYLRKKHRAQATSCVHTSSRSLVPWAEHFFLGKSPETSFKIEVHHHFSPKKDITGGIMSHLQTRPDQRCRELKVLLVSF